MNNMSKFAKIIALSLLATACVPEQSEDALEHDGGDVIAAQLAAPELGLQSRQFGPDVLYFGYLTPGVFDKYTFDQCATLSKPLCAATFATYFDDDGNFSHWGISLVCAGKEAAVQEPCFRDAALALGGSDQWP